MYDQYYASLAAAASAMSSGQPTPTATAMGSSVANSPIFSMFSSRLHDEEEDDEDEDRKPNVEYLDSLNAYRKRSRSSEDVGQPSKVKATKLDNVNGNGNGYLLNGYGHRNGSSGSFEDDRGPPSSQDMLIESQPEETKSLDDPICYGWCFYYYIIIIIININSIKQMQHSVAVYLFNINFPFAHSCFPFGERCWLSPFLSTPAVSIANIA